MKRIGDILTRYKDPVLVEDGVDYKQVTIRTNYQGVVLRGTKNGSDIGTKKQWRVCASQFILSRIDARNGAFGIIPQELEGAIVTNDFLAFEINEEEVEREFFNMFLQSPVFLDACVRASKGNTNRKRVDEDFFLNFEVNLPPLDKQHDVVNRINQARSSIDIVQQEIKRQLSLLSKLKQAILQESIQGKLTKNWRTARGEVEPAGPLLQSIREEKVRLIEEKIIRREKALPEIDDDETQFEIPEGWLWERLGNLCSKTGSGSTPSGGKSAYTKTGVLFLRSQNVYDEGLVLTDVAKIPSQIHERMANTTVYPNDLLLNITGGSIGRCALVDGGIAEANINQHVAIIRPALNPLERYLHLVVRSPYFQKTIVDVQTGAGREGLPKNKMDLIPIPLPSFAEQEAIVQRVGVLMTICRSLEQQIEQSREHAALLLQAVLREAFAPSE